MTTPNDLRRRFHELHRSGCFVIPNPWDVGSARLLQQLGFKALATTSSGFAWTQGRADNHVTLDAALAHFRAMSAAVTIPLNADFEGGFAVNPDGVATNVTAAAATGISGVSIEDSTGDAANPLFDFSLAVERIAAARQAIDASGTGVLLTGRSEGFIVGRPDLSETIRRLTAYADAGAECLFAPGLRSIEHIRETPGFRDGSWPREMTLDENRDDLQGHADDFRKRTGFTYTVLDPAGRDVIGCVYIYPLPDGDSDARTLSWVRTSHAHLDAPLRRAVSDWLESDWPFATVEYAPRA